ncbi:MAG: histidinol phosphate phosphatase [Rhodospirillaceae bacterium]|nr:histidinol phosphate phosphatase [Rhodospirillaceae bacterium]
MTAPEFISVARGLTEISRPILRRYYRTRVDILDKSDESPVTQADRECEAALRAAIGKAFPDHGIIGEEFGAERTEAEFVWVLDPLDGTRAFITGRPMFGTLIALTQGGKPILGIIDMPILGDTWLGATGHATTLNGETARPRACGALKDAYFSCALPLMFAGDYRRHLDALTAATKSQTFGGDCYQYGVVASGFLDLVVERSLGLYDFLALVPILEGAGAHITDWQGKALDIRSGDQVVAAGDRRVLDQALALLNS